LVSGPGQRALSYGSQEGGGKKPRDSLSPQHHDAGVNRAAGNHSRSRLTGGMGLDHVPLTARLNIHAPRRRMHHVEGCRLALGPGHLCQHMAHALHAGVEGVGLGELGDALGLHPLGGRRLSSHGSVALLCHQLSDMVTQALALFPHLGELGEELDGMLTRKGGWMGAG
jgi:hypothetical protein